MKIKIFGKIISYYFAGVLLSSLVVVSSHLTALHIISNIVNLIIDCILIILLIYFTILYIREYKKQKKI